MSVPALRLVCDQCDRMVAFASARDPFVRDVYELARLRGWVVDRRRTLCPEHAVTK